MDDFFDEEPIQDRQENPQENSLNADMPTPKQVKKEKRLKALLAVGLAVVSFVLGAFTIWFSLDEEIRTLIKVKRAIDQHYYKDVDDEEFYDAVFQGINYNLLDAYSQYMTADEYKTSKGELAGNRVGIGAVFSTVDANNNPRMLTVRVCGNSPAEAAGLQEGDCITAFGKNEAEMKESVIFDEFSNFLKTMPAGEDFVVRVQSNEGSRYLKMHKQ